MRIEAIMTTGGRYLVRGYIVYMNDQNTSVILRLPVCSMSIPQQESNDIAHDRKGRMLLSCYYRTLAGTCGYLLIL